jgi:hypothetical protein
MTIGYSPIAGYGSIGGSFIQDSGLVQVSSGATVSLNSLASVLVGTYMVSFNITYEIYLASLTFTRQEYAVTSSNNTFATIISNCYNLETTQLLRSSSVSGVPKYSVSGTGILVNSSSIVRLTHRADFTTTTGQLFVQTNIRLLRIG